MDDFLSPDSGLDQGLKFSIAAALSKQYSVDQRQFLASLASMLEASFPQETEIEKRGGLFSRKEIRLVTVELEGNRYGLEDAGKGPLRASRTHIVRGIALKTEEMPLPEWITEVGAALEAQMKTNAAARDALAQWLSF